MPSLFDLIQASLKKPKSPSRQAQDDYASLRRALERTAKANDAAAFIELASSAKNAEVFASDRRFAEPCVTELACRADKSEAMIGCLLDHGLSPLRLFPTPGGSESALSLCLKLAKWETAALIALRVELTDEDMGLRALSWAAIGAGRFPYQSANEMSAAGNLISVFGERALSLDPASIDSPKHHVMASASPHAGALKALIKLGGNVNAPGIEGRSALHVACSQASEEAVALLLSHGADVKALDNRGLTPLAALCKASLDSPRSVSFIGDIAEMETQQRVVAALLKAGADLQEASFVTHPADRARLGLDRTVEPEPPAAETLASHPPQINPDALERSRQRRVLIKPRAKPSGP